MTPPIAIPEAPSFEAAIALTQALLLHWETLSEAELEQTMTQLVSTENGARGFFVTYLTDDRPYADRPSIGVVQALRSSPETVSELLVKNLAMSTAMAIAHRRNGNEPQAQGSDRVQRRTHDLIRRMQLPIVTQKAKQLYDSAAGSGSYSPFLDRWGYDTEQRQAIQAALQQVI